MQFTDDQVQRYSRQILLQEIGGAGQQKLAGATVGVIGAGGLGCPAIQVLAATGVGHIRVYDADSVDLSNLPRQILYATPDVGKFKVDVIEERVGLMNHDVTTETHREFVTQSNVAEALNGLDYVIEATDNFGTKFLINDACVHFRIPFTIAGSVKFYGQVISVRPGVTACYRCAFGEQPFDDRSGSCSAVGVIGTNPIIAGTLQANEAIKSILGLPPGFTNALFLFDLLQNSFDTISLKKNPVCKACSDPDYPYYQEANYGNPVEACDE
jgi:molybdopterin/thiamine biosynthesis adenylyltransferase